MLETSGPAGALALRLTLACDLHEVRRAAEHVHGFLAAQGCDQEVLMDCELALVEACNNAIKYAPTNGRQKPVLVEALCLDREIELRVTDHTAGFDWPAARLELPDPESESGRGLYLIQSLMNYCQYFRGSGENVFVLRKNRPEKTESAEPPLVIAPSEAKENEQRVHDRLVAREREIAARIQQSLLLKTLPPLPGFELAASCRSAHQVGGDFYDALTIDEHSLLLVVADVMGKGVPAAMFAAILRTMLRAAPELTREPAALLARVNRLLFDELSGVDMFITVQLACVDAQARKLIAASAGHCPLLLAPGNGAGVQAVSPEGLPLGISPNTTFASEVVELPENCRALFYTDGLTEALNAQGERYGQERLVTWLEQTTSRPAEELKGELAEALRRFQADTVLNDDQTFVIMSAAPPAGH